MKTNEMTTLIEDLNQRNQDEVYCDLIDQGFSPAQAYEASRSHNWNTEASAAKNPADLSVDVDPTEDPGYVTTLFDNIQD